MVTVQAGEFSVTGVSNNHNLGVSGDRIVGDMGIAFAQHYAGHPVLGQITPEHMSASLRDMTAMHGMSAPAQEQSFTDRINQVLSGIGMETGKPRGRG